MNHGQRTGSSFAARPIRRRAAALLLGAALLAAGCTGEQGEPGRDGTSVDTAPPTISLVTPEAGVTVHDTLRVTANATDNVAVSSVTFYLDGDARVDDTTYVRFEEEPYTFLYDIFTLGLEDGPHTLMARATDGNGNSADTPTIVFYTETLPLLGSHVLRSWTPDSLESLPFPRRAGDDTTILDSLYNVRFLAERRCTVDSVRIWLDSLFAYDMAYDSPLRVALHASNGIYPTDTLATALLDVDSLERVGWHSVQLGPEVEFEEGGRFHVSLSVSAPTDTTLMGIGAAVVPRYAFASENRSGLYLLGVDDLPGFRTLQETSLADDAWTMELLVEAWVNYLP